jgi:hypothetical protein
MVVETTLPNSSDSAAICTPCATREHLPRSSVYDPPTRVLPRPVSERRFWTSSVNVLPWYTESPWNYYEPFLLSGGRYLVLCNRGAEVREMKLFTLLSENHGLPYIGSNTRILSNCTNCTTLRV